MKVIIRLLISFIGLSVGHVVFANSDDANGSNEEKVTVLPRVDVISGSIHNNPTLEIINDKELKRFKGVGNADIFGSQSSVDLNNVRNEASALDVNIRGMQGEGRVPILIDGSLQSMHTFRGYQGSSDRTYFNTDLLKQLAVTKGSGFSADPYAAGSLGGVVKVETISASDIVKPGQKFGVMIKGAYTNNNRTPHVNSDVTKQEKYALHKTRNNGGDFKNGSETVALGYVDDAQDILFAYGKQKVGNYFSGKRGFDKFVAHNMTHNPASRTGIPIDPREEVPNTSYESDSLLAKYALNITNEQRVEVNFRRHIQEAGEVLSALFTRPAINEPLPNMPTNQLVHYMKERQKILPKYLNQVSQWSLGHARVNAYSANYLFDPADNPYVSLKLNAYFTQAKTKQHNGLGLYGDKADQYLHSAENNRMGAYMTNESQFNFLDTKLSYGVMAQKERLKPTNLRYDDILSAERPSWQSEKDFQKQQLQKMKDRKMESRNGTRTERGFFINSTSTYKQLDILAGLNRHDTRIKDHSNGYSKKYKMRTDYFTQLSYHLTQNNTLYGKASVAYRQPSLYENTVSKETMQFSPKYPLTPEKATQYELGLVNNYNNLLLTDDSLNFKLNYFFNNTKNYISSSDINYKGKITYGSFSYETTLTDYVFKNYDKLRLKGVEVSLSYDSPILFTDFSGTFNQDAKVCSADLAKANNINKCNHIGFSGSLIPSRIPPKRVFVLTAGTYMFDKALSLGARFSYHSQKLPPSDWLKGTAAQAIKYVPTERMVDVFANYKFDKYSSMGFGVTNLTNKYSVDPTAVIAMPIPGRTVKLSFETAF